jgi:hypothetical protein
MAEAVEKALAPRIVNPWRVGCLGQAQQLAGLELVTGFVRYVAPLQGELDLEAEDPCVGVR